MTLKFAAFPSIEGFHNVVKLTKTYDYLCSIPIYYKSKIKLHGTNAGIRVHKGNVAIQSRTQIISSKNDNVGFASWVENNLDYWKNINFEEELTIFCEWCGPGIQKGTAINKIPNKIFAVFAIMVGGVGIDETSNLPKEDTNTLICEPKVIKDILGDCPPDVFILPWAEYTSFMVDFSNQENLQKVVDSLNRIVEQLEPSDPWVKDTFGVDGIAEGLVFYPLNALTRKGFSNFAFKAKGEKHKVVKTKESVQLTPEVAHNINEFVSMFVTEARLEQGLSAIGGSLELKNIGQFLKWMGSDIQKESTDELEVSGLEWNQVQSGVQKASREWFISKSKQSV